MKETDEDRLIAALLRIGAKEEMGTASTSRPDAELVAAYLDGTLFPEERKRVEAILGQHPWMLRSLGERTKTESGSGESTDPGGGGRVRETAGRFSETLLGGLVVAVAASVILVLSFLLSRQGSSYRLYPVPSSALVVATRGDVRLLEEPNRERPIGRGDLLRTGDQVLLASGSRIDVVRQTGHYTATDRGGWGIANGLYGIPGRVMDFLLQPAEPIDSGVRSAGSDEAWPLKPLFQVTSSRPGFWWLSDQEIGETYLRLESARGPIFREEVSGTALDYPQGAPDLVPGTVYSWTLEPGRGQPYFRHSFVVADPADIATLEERIEAVSRSIDDPIARNLLLVFVCKDLDFIDRAVTHLRELARIEECEDLVRKLLPRLFDDALLRDRTEGLLRALAVNERPPG